LVAAAALAYDAPFGVDVGGVEGDVGGAEVDAGDVEGVVADAVDDVGVGEAGGSRPVVEDPVVDTEHIVVVAACVADQGGRVVVGVGGAAEGTVDTCCAAGGEGIVPDVDNGAEYVDLVDIGELVVVAVVVVAAVVVVGSGMIQPGPGID